MVCTKQTYTANATWTAVQLADMFRSAFIDAGLMADWYDSFLGSTYENRILRIQYDATKTYGTTYYWFAFKTDGALMHVTTGWDPVAHVPTGTQYLHYFATTPASHLNFGVQPISSSTAISLVRYTSGVDTNQSWFVLRQGTLRKVFTIFKGSNPVQVWIDLNKGFISGFHVPIPQTNGVMGLMSFGSGPLLRREITKGCALNGVTNSSYYISLDERSIGYAAIGIGSNNLGNYTYGRPFIHLPIGVTAANPAYTSNTAPIFHSLPISSYFQTPLPSDIGISFHYATNVFLTGDTLVVTSGSEEWEILDFSANGTAVTGASPLLVARTV